ncbi:MAG: restriction endonuclease subunit S, partial [Nitrosarchaeum sp.]
ATTGKTSFVDNAFPYESACVNEHVFIIRTDDRVLPKFLFHFLRSNFGQKIISKKTQGTIGGINTKFVNDFPIIFPEDKKIQQTIIQKLDDVLGKLEKAKNEILKIKKGIEQKNSILSQTIDGYIIDACLPSFTSNTHPIMKLNEVCEKIIDPDHKMPPKVQNGIPLISTKDFTKDGEINFDFAKKISIQDYEYQTKRCKPEFDDILFSRYGTIGKARQIKTKKPFAMSYSLVLLKPNKNVITSDYLLLNLNSSRLQLYSIQGIRGGSIPDLGIKTIREFSIVVPSISEQKIIIEKFDKKKLNIDKIKKSIENTTVLTKHIEKMLVHQNNAILDKAFSGKLAK